MYNCQTLQNRISACDVSNDGIVVGSFEQREDIDTKASCYPGYYDINVGKWQQLPVIDEFFSEYYAIRMSFANEARAITPDAKFIAGNYQYKIGEKEGRDVVIYAATLWEKVGDEYVIKNCWSDLGNAGNNYVLEDGEFKTLDKDVSYRQFLVYDISNDGSTIVGMNVSGCGGFNPAFIRDGKMYQLFYCGEKFDSLDDRNFNGGVIQSIDANNNMFGYFQEEDGYTLTNFCFTTDGELKILNDTYTCSDKNGNWFTVLSNGLNPAFDCSEDGSVVVGATVTDLGFGAYNMPALVINPEVDFSGVENVEQPKSNVSINYNNGILTINGNYTMANIYDAAGTMVINGGRDTQFNLNDFANGVYVVKVLTPTNVETFKIAK